VKLLVVVFSCILFLQEIWAISSDSDSEIWANDKPSSLLPYVVTGGIASLTGAILYVLLGNKSSTINMEPSDEAELTLASSSSIVFAEPGTQQITISNNSPYRARIDNIKIQNDNNSSDSLEGIEQPNEDKGDSCINGGVVGIGKTCSITLEASKNAYGNGNVIVEYANGKKLLAVSIQVKGVDVELQQQGTKLNTISFSRTIDEKEDFDYLNKGKFVWKNAQVQWQGKESSCITLGPNKLSNVEPGGKYSFSLQTKSPCTSGDRGTIIVTGSNLENNGAINAYIVGDLAVDINKPSSDEDHLGYKSLVVANSVGYDITVGSIGIEDDLDDNGIKLLKDGLITRCASNETNYPSTCVDNMSLAEGEKCLIWFKADGKNADLQNISGSIKVKVSYKTSDNIDKTSENKFKITYDKSLYATGKGFVYKWNGKNDSWQSVGDTSLLSSSTGRALAINSDGDLCLGGEFETKKNLVVRWNGKKWLSLNNSSSGFEDSVYALAVSPSGELYAGGKNVLKKWNKNKKIWESMAEVAAGQIFAIKFYKDTEIMYISGNFYSLRDTINVGSGILNSAHFAKWDGASWSCLDGSTGNCDNDAAAICLDCKWNQSNLKYYAQMLILLDLDFTKYSFDFDDQDNLVFVSTNLSGDYIVRKPISGSNQLVEAISSYPTDKDGHHSYDYTDYYTILSDAQDIYRRIFFSKC
jgi:hypothetical protein